MSTARTIRAALLLAALLLLTTLIPAITGIVN